LKTLNNKIYITYFFYIFITTVIYLNLHLYEFPNKYVYTDWLINYEGGFVRRGLLGQIIFEISNFFNIEISQIILYFQIISYFLYFLLFFFIFLKIKTNFFWFVIIFSPVLFLYPIAELEALGRKDILVISLFLIFSLINYNSLNSLILAFICFFSLSTLIHEITVFYIFHYLFIIYIKNRFIIKQKFNYFYFLYILICILSLLYLALYKHNFVVIEDILKSYNYDDFTNESGSFSHIKPSLESVFLKTINNISLVPIIRIIFLIFLSLFPILFFNKIKEKYVDKYFNLKNIIFASILLAIPLYLLIFDWGRVIYINYNFLIIILTQLFLLKVFDQEFLDTKIKDLKKIYKVLMFILICLLFSPKILVTDDLSSFPLYRSVIKIIKITFI